MKVCPYCAHNNMEGILYCEECGQSLYGEQGAATSTKKLQSTTGELDGKATWGTARFGPNTAILIHIRNVPDPIELQPQDEMIFGRYDGTTTTTPTLDLTPFGAYENGVSRIHAAIRRSEDTLTLVDLGSVNGTHLNGQRLIPNQPRVVRDGDEVRFGKLVCHIFFKRPNA